MKIWLLFACAAMLCACGDKEPGTEPSAGAHPRFFFSRLSIIQTAEGSTNRIKKVFEYKDGMLSEHTVEQSLGAGDNLIFFDITAGATSHRYQCYFNGIYSYHIIYSVGNPFLSRNAEYVYREGDPRSYTMEYEVIDGKYYLASITERIQGKVYYVLTFDYSELGSGKIKLTQTLLGNERLRATLRVTRDNKAGIPDVNLNDEDFHPLDKHIEAVYGGLLGAFDYFISEIYKEKHTAVGNFTETVVSSVEFNTDGYPARITSQSDNKSKAVKYYEFGYE